MSLTSQRIGLFTIAAVLASVSLPSGQSQEPRPPDATAPDSATLVDRELQVQEPGLERDDPNARLEWERQAWGVATPASRATAMREGRDHSDKKNARGPKWVSIGPEGAEFDQRP